MNLFKTIFVSGLILTLPSCSLLNKAPRSEPILKKFIFNSAQCVLPDIPEDLELPCGMNTTPYLTSLDENLKCMLKRPGPSGFPFFKETLPELTEALIAVYKDKNETGYSGFHFKSKVSFEAFKASVKGKIKDDSVSLLFGKNLFFVLWKDPGGEACFNALAEAIPKQLKALGLEAE